MTVRKLAAAALLVAVAAVAPAQAGPKHCTVTVHHPLGTDEVETPVPLPDGTPTDIGFVKVYINCHRGR